MWQTKSRSFARLNFQGEAVFEPEIRIFNFTLCDGCKEGLSPVQINKKYWSLNGTISWSGG
ncbi:MAG: hypothetical protein U5N85_13725 [Arcicella sp.]|nr:hypothetical protein [Arcicella sp.]